jgi:lysophospholipase L1-like esterase
MRYTSSADEVLWLNVNEDNPLVDRRDYVNDEISSAVSRHPKLFLADMNGEFNGRPELRQSDGIHYNAEGQRLFAEFIRKQLEPFRPGAS